MSIYLDSWKHESRCIFKGCIIGVFSLENGISNNVILAQIVCYTNIQSSTIKVMQMSHVRLVVTSMINGVHQSGHDD